MNLDNLLKKVEKNYQDQNKTITKEIVIGGETFEMISLTRKEKNDFLYSKKLQGDNSIGDLVKWIKPYIYKSLQLAELASKAKVDGYINSYYDIVEMLFTPTEIMEIITELLEFNDIQNGIDIEAEVDDIKKQ